MSIASGLLGGLGGGAIGSAVVRLALDTTTYNGQLAAAEGKTEAATTTMSGSTAKASGAMVGLYAAAGAAAVSFGAAAIQSASEHEQVMAALTAAVGEDTQAFEDQATALQNLSGFQDEAILSADTLLSRFKLTDQQIQQAIPTILDVARALGQDVPDAASSFGKALLGNTRALKALGVEGFVPTGNRAEDFTALMEKLNGAVGGQAAAFADTYAGKLEILSARFDDLKEAVGGELIESLTDLADDLNIIIAAGQKLGDVAETDLVGGIQKYTGAIIDTINPTHLITTYLQKLDETFHLTDESAGELTTTLGTTSSGIVLLDETATHVDPAITKMQESLSGLEDATSSAGDGLLSLTGTVKETFNISQKEMDKGFEQMLRSAVRFENDIEALGKIDVGLNPQQEAKFEQFLISEGPGFVDRFVKSSQSKQDEWVAQWQRSIDSVKGSLRTIDNIVISPRVDLSAAQQQVSTLEGRLARLGGI